LILKGEETYIHNLDLDSTLLTGQEVNSIEGDFKDLKFVDYVPLENEDPENENLDEVVRIRGFKLDTKHEIAGLNILAN